MVSSCEGFSGVSGRLRGLVGVKGSSQGLVGGIGSLGLIW